MEHSAFEIKRSKDGQYYFNIVAKNGQYLATSELYKTKASCEKGIRSVIENVYIPIDEAQGVPAMPSRSNVAIRLSTLKRMGIETFRDVGEALVDGRLEVTLEGKE